MATQQILKSEYKKAIKEDPLLCAMIAKDNGKKNSTVETWCRDDNAMLTTATNLSIIKNYLKLSEDVEMTEAKEIAAEPQSTN